MSDVQPHTEPADAALDAVRVERIKVTLALLRDIAEDAIAERDALQRRIDRVIAFRNDALDTSQSPWLGKEIVSALDEALRSS